MMTDAKASNDSPTKGIQQPSEEAQLHNFIQGTHHVVLLRPATVKGGIIRLPERERTEAIDRYTQSSALQRVKFIPASGAATRMFKRMHSWIAKPAEHAKEIDSFFDRVEEFAFFDAWLEMANNSDVETFQAGLDSKVNWLKLLIENTGLAMGDKPKGLINFHQYDTPQTPVYEHLKEAMGYAQSGGVARVHFTISPEHEQAFRAEVELLMKRPEFADTQFEIEFSFQDPATDTVAVNLQNELVLVNGEKLKRPGGHGSLIHNLNRIDADLIFIKNIDNVAHDRFLPTTVEYKKVLAGVLLQLRDDLKRLEDALAKGLLDEVFVTELRDKWNLRIPKEYKKLKSFLGRPIRVCGMVKNQGEPGGGPFWVRDAFTGESLQIVEQAQINAEDARQRRIMSSATHFNPVDLVCCVRNLKGKKIDLIDYIDNEQYFIATKSHNGEEIKALEWPGLWNGAMAHWITLFVEVPLDTFNPVKEVADLLRPQHLPS